MASGAGAAVSEGPAFEHWRRIDEFLRGRLREDLYRRWFAPLRPVGLDGDRLQVAAPDPFHRDFVDDNYRDWFDDFVPALVGLPVRTQFVVDDAPRARHATPPEPGRATPPSLTTEIPPQAPRANLRYVFDTFVVGESNRFAVAAAQAVAKNPGREFNPLFLHGDSGLGKTHLLHAIAHALNQATPGSRVAIVTSERYTNDFVDALSRNTMHEFRRKYRECGALLIDDVQFFAGRDKTAEEFFHTFNTLYEQNVQIVLSSDRSPKELKGLEDRLCSSGACGCTSTPRSSRPAPRSSRRRRWRSASTCPTTWPRCSPPTSSPTCGSWRGR
jgi:chromosomal replication initiator protein